MKKSVYSPSLAEFAKLSAEKRCIPVYRDIVADTDTPVSAFLKIDDGCDAFLFESVEGGEKWGRYSFLGIAPRATFKSMGRVVEIVEDGMARCVEGDPLELLRDFISPYETAHVEGMARFYGGAVGYMGYDMVRLFEALPSDAGEELDLPDSFFMIADTVLIFDNLQSRIRVVSNVPVGNSTSPADLYERAKERIDGVIARLREGKIPAVSNRELSGEDIVSNWSRDEFTGAVDRAKEYIRAGDIIQVVLSQRFQTDLDVEPFDVYRSLRLVNPSPYMFFLRLGDVELVGSSPEILVRVEGSDIDVRPIAGTRPRGKSEREDVEYERELIGDAKERAEHIMLVDLGRNDIGRVSKTGSVAVDEFMVVERYSHVMHIVSNVHGTLEEDCDALDALRACFPAGTLTGAPKIRAMEIIDEMESCRRGPYGGAVGYIGFSGNMDMCITIRTILIKNNTIYIQAGAGIVADSDPESEFQETINKAKGMLKAVEIARAGLE
ncbi:MAG: anthranilate synthase component I [Thermodesulfobacteriota bacterium]